MIDKTNDLIELIKILAEPLTGDKFEICISKIHELYDDSWRHSYSLITRYFLTEIKRDSVNEVLVQTIENLIELHKQIAQEYDAMKDTDKHRRNQCANCRRNIEKLIDHINLEAVRIDYSEALKEESDKIARKNLDANRRISSELKDVSLKLKQAEEKLKSQQTHIVTMLGIFASIVVAYVSGSSLSAAIFANMDKVDTPLLCFLTALIVIFISNLVYYLFALLRKINGFEEPKTPVWLYNLVLGCVALVCFAWHCYTGYTVF